MAALLVFSGLPALAVPGDVTAPTSPVLIFPAPLSPLITKETSIAFLWSASQDSLSPPVKYRLQVSLSETFGFGSIHDTSGLTETSLTLTVFGGGVRFWRVTAFDAETNSALSTPVVVGFAIDTKPPDSFSLSSIAGAARTPPIAFRWNAPESGLRYRYQLSAADSFAPLVDSTQLTNDTFRVIGGLPAGTYYWRVVAVDDAGNTTAAAPAVDTFIVTTSSETAAPVSLSLVSPADGHETSNTSLTFRWSTALDSSGPVQYRLQIDTEATFSAPRAYQSSFILDTFQTNVPLVGSETYLWRVIATDVLGNTVVVAPRTIIIDTTPPSSPFLDIESGASTTLYRTVSIRLSATNGPTELQVSELPAFTGAAWTAYRTDSTWTFSPGDGVRTLNARFRDVLGNISDSVADTIRLVVPPSPPTYLVASVNAALSPILSWSPSPSDSTLGYRVRMNSGGATALGSAPVETIAHVTGDARLSWTGPALLSGVEYLFSVRAFDANGTEDLEATVVRIVATLPGTYALSARIVSPASGTRVGRAFVTLRAEIDPLSQASGVSSIDFQYRTHSETSPGAWTSMGSLDGVSSNVTTRGRNHAMLRWDLNGVVSGSRIADGRYEIRAVPTSTSGTADPSPPIFTLLVLDTDATRRETVVLGVCTTVVSVSPLRADTVEVGEPSSGWSMRFAIPVGGCETATSFTISIRDAVGLPAPSGTGIDLNETYAGKMFEASLGSGQIDLPTGVSYRARITWPDDDADGTLDGTSLRSHQVRLRSYSTDALGSYWDPGETFTWIPTERAYLASFIHFSFFVVAGPGPAENISRLRIYPNPFVPNDGDDDNGREYSGGGSGGIFFENLTPSSRVRILTMTGEVVADVQGSPTGTLQWDVRNQQGRPVASGIYYYIIEAGGQRVMGKLAIVR